MKQKNVVAIHDISCHGKCSLTVAMPIISATGITTNIIPTAVLSTHTGGFTNYTFKDLTDQISPIQKHWEDLNFKFDGIYTGFLGSFEQLDLVGKFIDKFKKNNIVIIDPAMADNGKMYPIFDMEFASGMADLCKKADIVVPNITEALFLLGKEYIDGPYSKSFIESILLELKEKLGVKKVVLTGTDFDDNTYGISTYDEKNNSFDYHICEKIGGSYHGTGDIYASALFSALLHDFPLIKSAEIAATFTAQAIKNTIENVNPDDYKSGMQFESALPLLIKNLKLI
ncbi:MAG: pyridoxamine kinase [Lachnospirales bacterium]